MKNNLGITIKKIRNLKGMTFSDLSKKSGISESHLSALENSDKKFNIDIVEKIAKGLDLKEEDLYMFYFASEDNKEKIKNILYKLFYGEA